MKFGLKTTEDHRNTRNIEGDNQKKNVSMFRHENQNLRILPEILVKTLDDTIHTGNIDLETPKMSQHFNRTTKN